MPRSLAGGDFRLVLATESASRQGAWYRQLIDAHTGALSCDCPRWLFARRDGSRDCKHLEVTRRLLAAGPVDPVQGLVAVPVPPLPWEPDGETLLAATRAQWPGLAGTWRCEQRVARVGTDLYGFVLVQLKTPDGATASGGVAFALAHGPGELQVLGGVAGWGGYAVAAEVARQAGYPLAGQPPAHFRLPSRGARRDAQLAGGTPGRTSPAPGLGDILRVGDRVDQGDGRTPAQRAEDTLRLFLGELYLVLERQGFLDVPSRHFAAEERVYRLRRDRNKLRDRRVRVFEHGRYVQDLCIVRAQAVPEGDHWLTVFLRLLSDELGLLGVVRAHNVFAPYSDGRERETETPLRQYQLLPARRLE